MGNLQPYIPRSPLTKPAFPCISLNSWPGSIRHNSPGATPVTLHPVVCFCRLLLWCLWLLLLLLLLLHCRLRCWLLCLLLRSLFLLTQQILILTAQDNVLEANVMQGNTQAWPRHVTHGQSISHFDIQCWLTQVSMMLAFQLRLANLIKHATGCKCRHRRGNMPMERKHGREHGDKCSFVCT